MYSFEFNLKYISLSYIGDGVHFMEIATILIIFVASLLVGITGYSIYSAFGPGAKMLTDPFEEHED